MAKNPENPRHRKLFAVPDGSQPSPAAPAGAAADPSAGVLKNGGDNGEPNPGAAPARA